MLVFVDTYHLSLQRNKETPRSLTLVYIISYVLVTALQFLAHLGVLPYLVIVHYSERIMGPSTRKGGIEVEREQDAQVLKCTNTASLTIQIGRSHYCTLPQHSHTLLLFCFPFF